MGLHIFETFTNGFSLANQMVLERIAQWPGRIVFYLDSTIMNLQNPAYASAAVFAINFALVEIAVRISKLVEWVNPSETSLQSNMQLASRFVLGGGLLIAGNICVVKFLKLSLHPVVIVALATASFGVRYILHKSIS